MSIKDVIKTANQMVNDGVIERYAIGGAVGATFYIEPTATMDVDIFVSFRTEPDSLIVNPKSVFEYLKARGAVIEGEYVILAGWPVQFLPSGTPLVEEALLEAVIRDVEDVPARVFTAEHLAAMALQTGRAKDKARLLQFIESGILDASLFENILARHGLMDRWQRFERQFLSDKP